MLFIFTNICYSNLQIFKIVLFFLFGIFILKVSFFHFEEVFLGDLEL